MLGYFEDVDATARAIDAGGWLHSGDEGLFRMHEGRPVFFVTGRLKEIIIRDAEKYSPLRLERRIVDALPDLSGKLVVLGFPHAAHGEEVGAYIETEELDDALRERLSAAIGAMPVAERPNRPARNGADSADAHGQDPETQDAAMVRAVGDARRRDGLRSVCEHHPVADAVLPNPLQGGVHFGHRRRLDLGGDAVLRCEREHLPDRGGAADVAAADRALTREEQRGRYLKEARRCAYEAQDAVRPERLQVRDPVETCRHGAQEEVEPTRIPSISPA